MSFDKLDRMNYEFGFRPVSSKENIKVLESYRLHRFENKNVGLFYGQSHFNNSATSYYNSACVHFFKLMLDELDM